MKQTRKKGIIHAGEAITYLTNKFFWYLVRSMKITLGQKYQNLFTKRNVDRWTDKFLGPCVNNLECVSDWFDIALKITT